MAIGPGELQRVSAHGANIRGVNVLRDGLWVQSRLAGHLIHTHGAGAGLPEFQKLHQSSPEKNIAVIAINFAESKTKVEEYLQNRQISFPILLDRYGDVSGKYKIRNLPVTYLISPDGIIQEEIFGGVTQEIIENKIDRYKSSL